MHYEVLFDSKFRIRSTIGEEAQLMSQKKNIYSQLLHVSEQNSKEPLSFCLGNLLEVTIFYLPFAARLFQDHGQGPGVGAGKHFS